MNKNSIAPVPPMGWNSWDCYGAAVNEEQLLGNAEYMAKYLKPYGWQYVVCDIQWYEPLAGSTNYNPFAELCTDEYSRVIPAVNRFPSSAGGKGFAPIAEKIHDMGLKFGIHIMRGIPRQAVHANTAVKNSTKTARDIAKYFSLCSWNTDMYGVNAAAEGAREYYCSLFELYASWGVDFVKVDDICVTEFNPNDLYSARDEIELIREAINSCGRDIVLSLSPGPADLRNGNHLSRNANMWRMTGDFWDNTESLRRMFDKCAQWYPWVREGCWPDCDMLPLGYICMNDPDEKNRARKTRFTENEQRTVMTLWSVFRSPLFFGGELRKNDEFTLSLITNEEVLAVNQSSSSAEPVRNNRDEAVWTAKMSDGKTVAALFNKSDYPRNVKADYEELGVQQPVQLRNLWKRQTVPAPQRSLSVQLEAMDCAIFVF